MSNFFFSHSVFKRLVLQIRKNQGLFGNKSLSHEENMTDLSNLKPTEYMTINIIEAH